MKNIRKIIREELENLNNEVNLDLINEIPMGDTFHDTMHPEYYNELYNDIKENGIQEPIILRYYFKDNALELLEGHHRVKIANKLNIKKIPVKIIVVWRGNIGDDEIIYNPPKKLNMESYIKRNYYPTFIEPFELGLI